MSQCNSHFSPLILRHGLLYVLHQVGENFIKLCCQLKLHSLRLLVRSIVSSLNVMRRSFQSVWAEILHARRPLYLVEGVIAHFRIELID